MNLVFLLTTTFHKKKKKKEKSQNNIRRRRAFRARIFLLCNPPSLPLIPSHLHVRALTVVESNLSPF